MAGGEGVRTPRHDGATTRHGVYRSLARPSWTRVFSIKPAAIGEPVEGTLLEIDLDAPPTYCALSYMWGQAQHPASITVNSKPATIRRTLHDALMSLRSPDQPLVLWIDAVSINQDDVEERNQQVKQMFRIYERAEKVFVWLGQPDATHAAVLRKMESGFDTYGAYQYHLLERTGVIDAVRWIESNPYFDRAWIKQEVFAATALVICLGSLRIPWETFATLCRESTIAQPGRRDRRLKVQGEYGARRRLNTAYNLISLRDNRAKKRKFEWLVKDYGLAACQDPRDRIFALLNLCDTKLHADYGMSAEKVFIKVMKHSQPPLRSFGRHLHRCLELDSDVDELLDSLNITDDTMNDRLQRLDRESGTDVKQKQFDAVW